MASRGWWISRPNVSSGRQKREWVRRSSGRSDAAAGRSNCAARGRANSGGKEGAQNAADLNEKFECPEHPYRLESPYLSVLRYLAAWEWMRDMDEGGCGQAPLPGPIRQVDRVGIMEPKARPQGDHERYLT